VGTVAACGLLLALTACGEDGATPSAGPPEPEPAPREPHPIEFVDGFAAGREAAGDDDALVFVYVGRHHPT
jgi:hypothetical protein